MSMRLPTAALWVLLALGPGLRAQDLRLPRLFADHMVLQRESQVRVWGWAEAGAAVTVAGSWGKHVVETVAGDDGAWQVRLPTGPAGGPYELTINERVLSDVLLGEVWVCSGQSNMEWLLAWTDDAKDVMPAAEHPHLRLFGVDKLLAAEPQDDVGGVWRSCLPKVAAVFSAVAYHFGVELLTELDVPIGLVSSSWGGTPAEAWTSAATLRRFDEFSADLERLQRLDQEPSLAELQARWWDRLEAVDPGFTEGWMGDEVDPAPWRDVELPGLFSDLDLDDFDGSAWFRRTFPMPDEWLDQELVLDLGPVDDMDITFLNGRPIGATREPGRWQSPRIYPISPGVARPGSNVLAVCAVDTAGEGGVGRGGAVTSGMRLRLASQPSGEGAVVAGTWQARTGAPLDELRPFPLQGPLHSSYPTALFNAMVAPLTRFTIRGVIFYQGESNRERAVQYRRLFPALIEDWRDHWGQADFPFYFVQIAPYAYRDDVGQAAELREAQARALSLPATGMAVTMDIGDPDDIHPANKREVGRRLALWALARDYGQDVECSGPLFESLEVEGRSARLHFTHAAGLTSDAGPPSHFTVAGSDRVFHPAEARIEGETVLVSCTAVTAPVAVRYAWGAADEPNLRNGAGLPAPSFRTDDWEPVSRER